MLTQGLPVSGYGHTPAISLRLLASPFVPKGERFLAALGMTDGGIPRSLHFVCSRAPFAQRKGRGLTSGYPRRRV